MLTSNQFFNIADQVVLANGRSPLTARPEVQECIQVRDSDRVLQILAGPGSGKTEVLVWRILFELFVRGVESSQIVVTTFTKKAANELQVRLAERSDAFLEIARGSSVVASDPRIHNLRIGTLHSICEQLLTEFDPSYREQGLTLMDDNEHRARLGFQGDWVVGRANGALSQLAQSVEFVGLFKPSWRSGNWPVNRFDRLSLAIECYAHLVETYVPRCVLRDITHGLEAVSPGIDQHFRDLLANWSQYLTQKGVIDFAGIQLKLLNSQQALHGRFSHVFVDEFQDNNPIQFAIHLGWLSDPKCNLTVVGDDDQAIYRFRGSDAACFRDLGASCASLNHSYRFERLEINHRSTRNICAFTQAFRVASAINDVSLPKTVQSPQAAIAGTPVRVIRGPLVTLAEIVAGECRNAGFGNPLDMPSVSVAILCSSTSERSRKPASAFRAALEPGIRVYNPRAKTAAQKGSALADLLGILSYFIDPVSMEPVGSGGRPVMVHALHPDHGDHALTARPSDNKNGVSRQFPENSDHVDFQKWFRKVGRGINDTPPLRQDILNYVDGIKSELLAGGRTATRLTLAGLVARILTFPYFVNQGFSVQLLRQALFTQLLEAFIIPTRQTMNPIDQPLEVGFENGKWVWHAKYWRFLAVFGSVLKNVNIDDTESEAFEEGAIPLITFHQAKGLEFDEVYVIGGGKNLDTRSVLKNTLFGGIAVSTAFGQNGITISDDPVVILEAQADVDRELYVAISRAKRRLTLLSPTDIDDDAPYAREHAVISRILTAGTIVTQENVGLVETIEVSYE